MKPLKKLNPHDKVLQWGVFVALLMLTQIITGCMSTLQIERRLTPRPYDWLMYGASPDRTNQSPSFVSPPLTPIWQYNASAGISGTPLVMDSIVLVGTLKGELHGIRLSDGEGLGYSVLESAVAGSPVWDGNFVYVALASGTETMVCLSLRDGRKEWTGRYGPIETSPLLIGEFLYVTTLDGTLIALKKVDGTKFWEFETDEKDQRKPIRSSPASDGGVIVFGSDDGWVYAVERLTAKLRWKYQTGASVFATPIIREGVCIVGSLDRFLYALDSQTGELRWKYDMGSKIFGPAAASQSLVFIGGSDGTVTALSLATGKKVWSFSAHSVVDCAPLVAGDILYVGSLDRTLYALRLQTGEKVWEYEVEGRIRVSPVIWGDRLLLTCEDKYITAFRSSGK